MREKDGSRFPRRAFSPCCFLLQLSIFNLGCRMPIGSSATRRCLIGCRAQCTTQALFSPLSSATVLQCREDCSSLLLKPPENQISHLPKTHPDHTGRLPFVKHGRCSSTGLTGCRSDSFPRCALSHCVRMASILKTLSPWLLCAPHTQHMHTTHTHSSSRLCCKEHTVQLTSEPV